eukprot:TRINITY_DN10385_c0_g1_i2.p1 TRINITY_DN10385_c0_g1~~TRINITY_DN10385_c0_g1_i2.p1  ORF type:complete len:256 (+),score=63.44 TRINITY_DN10385_c0_g1_i2:78-770(+)
MEDLVKRNFSEWGDVEYVRIIWEKSIAFVKYKLRAAAEFAKEAMADQSLGYKEVINVRWANEDPNPRAQAQGASDLSARLNDAVIKKYGEPKYNLAGLASGDAYPNTSQQYPNALPAPNQQMPAQQHNPTATAAVPVNQNTPNMPQGIQQQQQAMQLRQYQAYVAYYQQQMQLGLAQMTPEQRAAYQQYCQQYSQYMQQMQMQQQAAAGTPNTVATDEIATPPQKKQKTS